MVTPARPPCATPFSSTHITHRVSHISPRHSHSLTRYRSLDVDSVMMPLTVWLAGSRLLLWMFVCVTWSVSGPEPGLDYPIGPLGPGLGPRACRGPRTLDETISITIIGLQNRTPPKFSLAPTALAIHNLILVLFSPSKSRFLLYYLISLSTACKNGPQIWWCLGPLVGLIRPCSRLHVTVFIRTKLNHDSDNNIKHHTTDSAKQSTQKLPHRVSLVTEPVIRQQVRVMSSSNL